MTCILGLEYDGGIAMGGDSASSNGSIVRLSTTPKVFRLPNMLIGYTWSFRMGQIIQYSKDVPKIKAKKSNYKYLINDFVPFLRDIFKDAGWLKTENSRDEGGEFLIGLRGEIFKLQSDFSVLRYDDGFAAVGSGADFALGALHTLKEKVNQYSEIIEPPWYMVELALESAAYYSPHVSAPFVLLRLEDQGVD